MKEKAKSELNKEQTVLRSTDSNNDKHLKTIQDQVDAAKDPSSYDTYDYRTSGADERIKLFAARRKGTNHIINKTPCQDYCLTASLNGCTILANSDGVSSCEHSDVGAKLACEAVVLAVEAASKSCVEETQLVNRLLSIPFRDRLVSIWIKNVMGIVEKEGELSPEDRLKEIGKYGATIMYAVITNNWIVVGNLGDGQILVFNDFFGVKLRVHAPKYNSRVRCLVNERCAREDFLVAKYPRSNFNGVLMSSDGMYECMDKGTYFFDYCMQIKKRFLDRTPNEPYQAFCYKEEGEPYKDFSRMRTQDDCSITMAIDNGKVSCDYNTIMDSMQQHTDRAIFKRWSPECMVFYTRNDGSYTVVNVSQKDDKISLPDKLETAILECPKRIWEETSYLFSEYADNNASTIEFLYSSGMLRRDNSNPSESEQMILKVYLHIIELKRELYTQGLELNSSAMFNLAYNGESLLVKREAIKKRDSNLVKGKTEDVDIYFSHLLGVIESGDSKIPIFDIGYIDRGAKHYRIGHPTEELVQLIRIDKKLHLKNISSYSWILDEGQVLLPKENLELGEKIGFTLIDDQGKKLEKYSFISKELL